MRSSDDTGCGTHREAGDRTRGKTAGAAIGRTIIVTAIISAVIT
jgi:hypothetical protein